MTQNDLREKVINAEAKVAKRKAVLKKHREQLAKLIQKGADEFDISIKKDDIESAKRKLEEAEKILNNWKEKLDERITADDYLEANAPEILKDFLENWKQHAIAYYRQRRIDVIEFRKDLKAQERAARLEALQTLPSLERARKLYEGREVTDYDLANLWPRKDVDEFLLCRAPPKWRHYALHAKRARVRKKYRNRIRRAFFAALASEGGGSS